MLKRPVRQLGIYLYITLLIYISMYIATDNQNMFFTVVITSFFFLCFVIGGISYGSENAQVIKENISFKMGINTIIFIRYCCISLIVVSLVNVFTVYTDFIMVMKYIQNPGKAYEMVKFVARHGIAEGAISGIPSLIGVFLNMHTFTKYVVIVFGITYWKKISFFDRILVILSIIIYILHSFLIGAMINIGTLLFTVLPFLWMQKNSIDKNTKRSRLIFVLAIAMILIVIMYFRGSRDMENADKSFLETVYSGFIGLLGYAAHGYVGLAECLDLPWKSTFGMVSFRGLTYKLFPNIFEQMWEHSYLFRNELVNRRPSLQVWSTIFPWLASDFSFFSIPFIMFAVGRLITFIWLEVIYNRNPYALLLMSQLLIFTIMIPANNQLFHTFGNASATIICSLLYLIYLIRNKYFKSIRIACVPINAI